MYRCQPSAWVGKQTTNLWLKYFKFKWVYFVFVFVVVKYWSVVGWLSRKSHFSQGWRKRCPWRVIIYSGICYCQHGNNWQKKSIWEELAAENLYFHHFPGQMWIPPWIWGRAERGDQIWWKSVNHKEKTSAVTQWKLWIVACGIPGDSWGKWSHGEIRGAHFEKLLCF